MTCSGLFGNSRVTHFSASAAKCDACFSVRDWLLFIWAWVVMVKKRMVKQTKKAFIVSDSVTVRWSTDVNVRPGRGAGDRLAERRIRNSVLLQKVQQRTAFDAVRMKLNIHGVVMVQAPAVVN